MTLCCKSLNTLTIISEIKVEDLYNSNFVLIQQPAELQFESRNHFDSAALLYFIIFIKFPMFKHFD